MILTITFFFYYFYRNLLFPTIIYADRYIKKRGQLPGTRDLFNLLLTSALVAVKMWEDCGVNFKTVLKYTGITRKQICSMERQFLGALEYSLFLSAEDVIEFVTKTREENSNYNHQYNNNNTNTATTHPSSSG